MPAKSFGSNIARLRKKGYPQKQAIAISYSEADKGEVPGPNAKKKKPKSN